MRPTLHSLFRSSLFFSRSAARQFTSTSTRLRALPVKFKQQQEKQKLGMSLRCYSACEVNWELTKANRHHGALNDY